jgi:hypothetical protein
MATRTADNPAGLRGKRSFVSSDQADDQSQVLECLDGMGGRPVSGTGDPRAVVLFGDHGVEPGLHDSLDRRDGAWLSKNAMAFSSSRR